MMDDMVRLVRPDLHVALDYPADWTVMNWTSSQGCGFSTPLTHASPCRLPAMNPVRVWTKRLSVSGTACRKTRGVNKGH